MSHAIRWRLFQVSAIAMLILSMLVMFGLCSGPGEPTGDGNTW